MKKRKLIIIVIPLLLLLAFGLTYIPHQVVNIKPSKVSKITVFDGNTGFDLEINDKSEIDHLINNLNSVTFQKGKLSLGYMGYSFRITIYNLEGKTIKNMIVNSNDRIRYKGFFYTAKANNSIDYDFIKQLFEGNNHTS